jgi:DNA-binding MarR family transcriptional regulator
VIRGRLSRQPRTRFIELANPLMSMILLPYMGAGVARQELERVTPKSCSGSYESTPLADPFREAGMRLTYRTVRVLMAVAEHPGASNRAIGDISEIKDQGQISKMLGRLQRVGMISNAGAGPRTGAPNVWTLTPSGRRVSESIRAHTEGNPSRRARERDVATHARSYRRPAVHHEFALNHDVMATSESVVRDLKNGACSSQKRDRIGKQ